MTYASDRRASRWAHGLAPVPEHEWHTRRSDAEKIIQALESTTTPEISTPLGAAIRRMTSVFGGLSRQSSRDWFVTSSMMSHPSPRLARRIVSGLIRLHGELNDDNIPGINAALDNLEAAYLPKMLDSYLDATRPINPTSPSRPAGWAYLLNSTSEPSMFLAGSTDGWIGDVISQTDRANPDMADFGIAAAWRVTDPDLAGRMIAREIGHRLVANGYHQFNEAEELFEARRDIDSILSERKIVVGNPFWEPTAGRSLLATDPYSHDVRNRKFKVDLGSVFEAFRR